MSGEPPPHRRTVLKALGLAGGASAAGVPLGCRPRPDRPQAEEAPIFDLSFRVVEQYRPFALVAPGFTQVEEPGRVRLTALHRTGQRPVAPFVAVELEVDELPPSGVSAGLFGTDAGDAVAVRYDAEAEELRIEVTGGSRRQTVRRVAASLRPPFRLGFGLCENQVTGLTDTGDGWRARLTAREEVAALVDLRDPRVLSRYVFGFGPGREGEALGLSGVRAGHFGMTGVRDPHLVQHPDGRAYVRDGQAYLTFTCAGLGFFQQAHWGLFTLDLDPPWHLEQVAQLYTLRDGVVLGDHAGQVVVDEAGGRAMVATSSWGDFDHDGVHVRHVRSDADVLSGVHLLETEPLDLPTDVGTWDPSLTRIGDRWHVGFVESPSQDPFHFYPALAVGAPGGDYASGLRKVGADRTVRRGEGVILQQVAGEWFLLASDGDRREYRVYDLSMRLLGTLDAPYLSNIPHPQIVPLPGGGHLLVTFEGTQFAESVLGYGGHGDLVVMSAR